MIVATSRTLTFHLGVAVVHLSTGAGLVGGTRPVLAVIESDSVSVTTHAQTPAADVARRPIALSKLSDVGPFRGGSGTGLVNSNHSILESEMAPEDPSM